MKGVGTLDEMIQFLVHLVEFLADLLAEGGQQGFELSLIHDEAKAGSLKSLANKRGGTTGLSVQSAKVYSLHGIREGAMEARNLEISSRP